MVDGPAGGSAAGWGRLLAPGERLGWSFRDRNLFRRAFPEPAPVPVPVPPQVHAAALRARQRLGRRLAFGIALGLLVTGVLGCCAGVVGGPSGDAASAAPVWLLAGLAGVATVAVVGVVLGHYLNATSQVGRVQAQLQARHGQELAGWQQRRVGFEVAERQRVDAMLEWGSAAPAPGSRRIDVVGGTLWGWEALLTVFGASLLRTHGPMTLVDLSGEAVCRELLHLAASHDLPVDVQLLPTELADSDLLHGLSGRQVADVLVESMHADTDAASRADRSMDDRILSTLCAALGPEVSMGRLSAGLRVLMGEPGDTPELSAAEQARIADELFSDEYRRQAHDNLRRVESYLHPLRDLGTRGQPRPRAALTCVAMATEGRAARTELLNDLIVQWLTRRLATDDDHPRSLVIVGADELAGRHVERLSDICDRRGIRLVLLFRHLRETSLRLLGAGPVAFMRLGNHEEATRAADFIGRQHRFVISQLTRTLGGNQTHTQSTTEGTSVGQGRGTGRSTGGNLTDLILPGRVLTRSESRTWNTTRTWAVTAATAEGSHWSQATTTQRVYEYTVEPRVLQNLPDYAMLLVEPSHSGPVVQAVECNPDIITLPRFSMDPLPPAAFAPQPAIPDAATPAPWQAIGGSSAPVSAPPYGVPTSPPPHGVPPARQPAPPHDGPPWGGHQPPPLAPPR